MTPVSIIAFALAAAPSLVADSPAFEGGSSAPIVQPAAPAPNSRTIAASQRAEVSLIAESDAVHPGETFTLGVRFQMQPGWHIYWPGQNDAGDPPTIDLKLPEGWTAGEIQWPAPKRHVAEIILDHIYEGQVTLLIPVSVPAHATPGKTATIRASLVWMICEEVCIFERGERSIDLSIARPGAAGNSDAAPAVRSTPGREAIEAARRLLPRPITDRTPGITIAQTTDKLRIIVPNASRLEFYPSKAGPALHDALSDAAADGDTLDMSWTEPPDSARKSRPFGVLAVWERTGGPAYYVVP
jgi:DsbC/DsbD-like thiol-disulfide interchange protein